ncbi:MAG: pitrilysin family protein [bacterium]
MPVLLINLPDSYGVSINVFIKVGSRNDPQGKEGLSHFVEHMLFKGTKTYQDSITLAKEIEKIGGDTNAHTSFENTGYYIKIPSEKLTEGVRILSDVLENSLFDASEMEKERNVIIEEIKMYNDDPQSDLFDNVFLPTLYKDTPLRVSPTGFIESVNSIHRDDLVSFVSKNYISNQMLIVLSGKFDMDESVSILNKEFSWVKEDLSTKSDTFTDSFKMINEKIIKDKKLEQSHILIGGMGLSYDDSRKYAYYVGNTLLGVGFTSKLFTELREKRGMSYYQGSSMSALSGVGFYSISAGVSKDRVEEAIKVINSCVEEIKSGNFTNEDLERVKTMIESSMKKDLESVDDFAGFFGYEFLKTGIIKTTQEFVNIYNSITKEDVIKVFNEVCTDSNKLICVEK